MKAIRLHEFGPPENLLYEDVPDPEPGEGQVRIAVEAGCVHVIDTPVRAGRHAGRGQSPALPIVPGRDAAGVVDAVGFGVDAGWVGQRVVAPLGPAGGGHARLAVASAEALHPIPAGLDAAAAAAMIGTGRTAVGLLDAAALTSDDVLLVTAAAGGLGSLFLQAGRNAGAVVVGAAGGASKVTRVRELGADVPVDYGDPEWPARVRDALGEFDGGREVSVVLDGVGGDLGRAAMELLGMGGRLLMFGRSSGTIIPFTSDDVIERGLTVSWAIPRLLRQPGGLRVLETRALAEAAVGRLVPAVHRFPLERAADAHRAIETRATTGTVVLV